MYYFFLFSCHNFGGRLMNPRISVICLEQLNNSGVLLLTFTAVIDTLSPPKCFNGSNECRNASTIHLTILYAALALAYLENRGTRFTIGSMGANQFHKPNHQAIFFYWYTYALYTSNAIGSTVLLYIEDNVNWVDITSYQRLVGKLLCAIITRPDICYAVQTLSQFMQSPKKSHWESALRVVRYLKSTVGQCVWLQAKPTTTLTCWCDFDWTACPNTRRSIIGYVVKFGESLVSWKSKK